MGDLFCVSEIVSMEDHDVSAVGKDGTVLLEETHAPAGQTLCSCGELHHSQDGSHEQCMDGDSLENEVDISGSISSETKRGKGGAVPSHEVSEYSEPKESSTYEPSPPFLVLRRVERRCWNMVRRRCELERPYMRMLEAGPVC